MVSIRFLSTTLFLSQALSHVWNGLNPGDTVLSTRPSSWSHPTGSSLSPSVITSVIHLNPYDKRQDTTVPGSTTSSLVTVTSVYTTTVYGTTVTSTSTVTVTSSTTTVTTSASTTPSTTSPTTTSTTSSSSTTSSCPTNTPLYVIQASGTGDFAVDGNFVQLQSVFGSGYTVQTIANRQNAQQFHLAGPNCDTLFTSDNALQAMVGSNANLHTVYFFKDTATASSVVNTNWESLSCVMNADNTLACTAMGQSLFQITPGQTTLEIGDQNYGEAVVLNLVPVPGTAF